MESLSKIDCTYRHNGSDRVRVRTRKIQSQLATIATKQRAEKKLLASLSKRVARKARRLLFRPGLQRTCERISGRGTDWTSVRGFLAGTVKKKPGFSLTTSKAAGDVRRYRIETRRGR
jgi:hypothetical protein